MTKKLGEHVKQILEFQKHRSWWRKIMYGLALVVVFCTAYMMILPAITMERKDVITCGLEEHTHTEGCYEEQQILCCGLQEDESHTHVESCYKTEMMQSCVLEEHIHTGECYADSVVQPEDTETDDQQGNPDDSVVQPEDTETDDQQGNPDDSAVRPEDTETTDQQGNPDDSAAQPEDPETTGQTEDTKAAVIESSDPAIGLQKTGEQGETTGGKTSREVPGADAGNTETGTPSNPNGFELGESNISSIQIFMQEKDKEEWKELTGTQSIPGDADLRLDVAFHEIPKAQLTENKIIYNIPDILRVKNASGEVIKDDEENPIGTIEISNGQFIINLYQDWIDKQEGMIGGKFSIQSSLNLSYIKDHVTEDRTMDITGGIKIQIGNNVADWIAQYNGLKVKKEIQNASGQIVIEHADDGDYLTYQLTATAGPDGVTNARITDYFTAGAKFAAEYVEVTTSPVSTDKLTSVTETKPDGKTAGTVYYGNPGTDAMPVPESGQTVAKPGTLVWQIGAMDPGEVRTLTYKVKLVDGYSGKKHKHNEKNDPQIITNQAESYSGNYKRDETAVPFEPKGEATLKKSAPTIKLNPDGIGGTITYRIWVQALTTNNFTISNVKLYDFFIKSANATSTQVSPGYVILPDKGNFVLTGKDENGNPIPLPISTLNPDKNAENPVINAEDKSFVCYIGDMEPGEEKTLEYTVTLDDIGFLTNEYLNSAGQLDLHNRARIFAGGETESVAGGGAFNAFSCNSTFNHYTWGTKAVSEEVLQVEQSVQIGSNDAVYKFENRTWTLESAESAPESFLVPEGSLEYNVTVNDQAFLSVNQATMKDILDENLIYEGYIKVSAYSKQSGTQYASVDYSKNPVKTVWLKADGLKTFSFIPKDLGFTEDTPYAYKLTYYASPVGLAPGQIKNDAENRFLITGKVGKNGKYYTLDAAFEVQATVHGSSSFNAHKRGWYYSRSTQGAAADWQNGELYWYIELSGTSIPVGTSLKDIPVANDHEIKSDSLVGVYFGTLSAQVKDCSALENMTELQENVDYTAEVNTTNNELTVTFSREYPLNNGLVYIVVKTSPTTLPKNLKTHQYQNGLYLKDSSEEYIQNQMTHASQIIAGDNGISKEIQVVFIHNGSGENETLLEHHEIEKLDLTQITAPGIYTEWLVTVNYHGNLSGNYLVEDQLPEGLEPVYVRGYSFKGNPNVTSPDISDYEGSSGWRKTSSADKSDSNRQQKTTAWYYNADARKVCWAVNGLQSDPVTEGGAENSQTAQFQIVCRVTDQDVLLGIAGASIRNDVILKNSSGDEVGNSFDSFLFEQRTNPPLEKGSTENSDEITGHSYPFTITVNPDGIDMIPGKDKIRLVDEMSESLTLNPDTIQVIWLQRTGNTVTEVPLNYGDGTDEYRLQKEKQILTITIPDNRPIKITYEARINAAPNTPVNISNDVHWEGYTSSANIGTTGVNKMMVYSVSASMTSTKPASLKIIKLDANDINTKLSGAEFSIQEVEFNGYDQNGQPIVTEKGDIYTGATGDGITTGELGILRFPKTGENWMHYNKIYKVVETKAPTGYVLDGTTYYIALASKEDNGGTYPTFPKEVDVIYEKNEFELSVDNQKGQILVDKKFGGTESGNVPGTYTFGLFQEGQEATPVQRLTITYENGKPPVYTRDGVKAASPTFRNMDLTKTYKVRELDSDGNPIETGGCSRIGNQSFEVTYTNNANNLNPSAKPSVTIQNRLIPTYVLPATGGTGTRGYYLAGLAIMLGTGLGYCKKSRKKRKTRELA